MSNSQNASAGAAPSAFGGDISTMGQQVRGLWIAAGTGRPARDFAGNKAFMGGIQSTVQCCISAPDVANRIPGASKRAESGLALAQAWNMPPPER